MCEDGDESSLGVSMFCATVSSESDKSSIITALCWSSEKTLSRRKRVEGDASEVEVVEDLLNIAWLFV